MYHVCSLGELLVDFRRLDYHQPETCFLKGILEVLLQMFLQLFQSWGLILRF